MTELSAIGTFTTDDIVTGSCGKILPKSQMKVFLATSCNLQPLSSIRYVNLAAIKASAWGWSKRSMKRRPTGGRPWQWGGCGCWAEGGSLHQRATGQLIVNTYHADCDDKRTTGQFNHDYERDHHADYYDNQRTTSQLFNFLIPQVMRGYRGRREETEQTIQDQWSAFKSLLELLISTFCKMSHIDNVIVHIYFFLLGFNVAKSTKIGLTEFV